MHETSYFFMEDQENIVVFTPKDFKNGTLKFKGFYRNFISDSIKLYFFSIFQNNAIHVPIKIEFQQNDLFIFGN